MFFFFFFENWGIRFLKLVGLIVNQHKKGKQSI